MMADLTPETLRPCSLPDPVHRHALADAQVDGFRNDAAKGAAALWRYAINGPDAIRARLGYIVASLKVAELSSPLVALFQ